MPYPFAAARAKRTCKKVGRKRKGKGRKVYATRCCFPPYILSGHALIIAVEQKKIGEEKAAISPRIPAPSNPILRSRTVMCGTEHKVWEKRHGRGGGRGEGGKGKREGRRLSWSIILIFFFFPQARWPPQCDNLEWREEKKGGEKNPASSTQPSAREPQLPKTWFKFSRSLEGEERGGGGGKKKGSSFPLDIPFQEGGKGEREKEKIPPPSRFVQPLLPGGWGKEKKRKRKKTKVTIEFLPCAFLAGSHVHGRAYRGRGGKRGDIPLLHLPQNRRNDGGRGREEQACSIRYFGFQRKVCRFPQVTAEDDKEGKNQGRKKKKREGEKRGSSTARFQLFRRLTRLTIVCQPGCRHGKSGEKKEKEKKRKKRRKKGGEAVLLQLFYHTFSFASGTPM